MGCTAKSGLTILVHRSERVTRSTLHEQEERDQFSVVETAAAFVAVSEVLIPGGHRCLDDELALNGTLFVLRTGIAWNDLPQELSFGSDMACWRRLREWRAVGV